MKKSETLAAWRGMSAGRDPLPEMRPIPYKAAGSKYGSCGIRIDGTPAFVDAVLSNLKSLLDGENHVTRLELARHSAASDFKGCPNADTSAEVCYIRLHMRGGQGAMVSAFFDKHLAGATSRFAAAHGIAQ